MDRRARTSCVITWIPTVFLALSVGSTALAAERPAAEAVAPTRGDVAASLAMTRAYDRAVQSLIRGHEASAEAHYREAIAAAEQAGIRDVRYALSCVELAMLRARSGDTHEAVELMSRAHAARRAELGRRHPDVVETRLMLRELQKQQRIRGDGAALELSAR